MHDVKRILSLAAALAATLAAVSAPALAAVEDDFSVATTADLVALCDADPGEENYAAAIHFCVGFGVGAYQYYLALAANDPSAAYVCLPNPAPARDAVKEAYVAWARANPAVMTELPVDSLFHYLGETYPCPDASVPTLDGGRP